MIYLLSNSYNSGPPEYLDFLYPFSYIDLPVSFFRDFNFLNSSKNPRVQIIEIKSLSDKSPDDSDDITSGKIKGTKATSILAVSPLKHTGTCFHMFFFFIVLLLKFSERTFGS